MEIRKNPTYDCLARLKYRLTYLLPQNTSRYLEKSVDRQKKCFSLSMDTGHVCTEVDMFAVFKNVSYQRVKRF